MTDVRSPLDPVVDELWERRAELSTGDDDARKAVVDAIDQLDAGTARVAWVDSKTDDVVVDERAKRAILLSFKVLDMVESSAGDFRYHDRMPLKTTMPGVRVVPGAIVRWGSYLAPGVVAMPSFTNIGGYVDSGSMLDTWATVGSCAQVGRNVHLSGGVGLGGVLEPAQAAPVIVQDDAFIGSRSMVVEGARVREGAKLGAGSILTKSTRVFDATTGHELPRGEAPAWSVCVGSTRVRSFPGGDFGMPCLLVLRRLAPGEGHDKLQLNDVLREHGVAP
ncbi:MAG TPA: 2,3,4,5-tetrahydropyridine-2,6-dicarboxylate N-succinyltransferase [Actinomycetes bacterium]|nr:2,3,4,5-tetrahydropyridine-2,6-dicarboxylate N-succinyltransferase [Actinomycetes bacterium]